jgi:hypothetical protein
MKELKEVLHLYLGCKIVNYPYPNHAKEKSLIGRLRCVMDDKVFIQNKDKSGNDWPHLTTDKIDAVMPILRALSDMTEDECVDVYTIERDRQIHAPALDFDARKEANGFIVTRLDLLNERLMIGFTGQVYKVIEEGKRPHIEPIRNQHEITLYLLSKQFDLFGLIQSGLALDKNTLNPTTND